MQMKFNEKGKIIFFIGKLTIEAYYPYIILNKISYGIRLDTFIQGYRK